jgi:hypothetical protein
MPPVLAIIVNLFTIFMVLSLYFIVYTQYNKREDPNDSAADVWKKISGEQRENVWNGFLTETIAQAKTGPVGNFVSYEKTPPVMARLYMLT